MLRFKIIICTLISSIVSLYSWVHILFFPFVLCFPCGASPTRDIEYATLQYKDKEEPTSRGTPLFVCRGNICLCVLCVCNQVDPRFDNPAGAGCHCAGNNSLNIPPSSLCRPQSPIHSYVLINHTQVIVFHVLFMLCQASFFKTTLTDPGRIPDGYLEQVFFLFNSLFLICLPN
jgi:hypothetical protein